MQNSFQIFITTYIFIPCPERLWNNLECRQLNLGYDSPRCWVKSLMFCFVLDSMSWDFKEKLPTNFIFPMNWEFNNKKPFKSGYYILIYTFYERDYLCLKLLWAMIIQFIKIDWINEFQAKNLFWFSTNTMVILVIHPSLVFTLATCTSLGIMKNKNQTLLCSLFKHLEARAESW